MDFSKVKKLLIDGAEVTSIRAGGATLWAKPSQGYQGLCFTAAYDGASVAMMHGGSTPQVYLECSYDGEEWQDYSNGTTLSLPSAGDKVYFRAMAGRVNSQWGYNVASGSSNSNRFKCKNVDISGKLVSIMRQDMDESQLASSASQFMGMFRNYDGIADDIFDASKLELPSMPSGNYKYLFGWMFSKSNVRAIPKFPVIRDFTYGQETFGYTFSECSKLTSVPAQELVIKSFGSTGTFEQTFSGSKNADMSGLKVVFYQMSSLPSSMFNRFMDDNTGTTGKLTFDFTRYSSVPTIQSSTFNNAAPLDKVEFLVPSSLESEWKAATNWTVYASCIRGV